MIENRTITLRALRSVRLESGLTGTCVVLFHPSLSSEVLDLPNFTPWTKYSSGPPRYPEEFGKVEVFRLVSDGGLPIGSYKIVEEK